MTASAATAPTAAPATPCPHCHGKGSHIGIHYWSDGPGHVEYTCELCEGAGTYDKDLLGEVLRLKAAHAKAASELNALRGYVALYLTTSEGTLPNPPLANALGASTYPSTWLPYLKREARMAKTDPNYTTYKCECGEYTSHHKDEGPPRCRVRRHGHRCEGKVTALPKTTYR